jgi:transcriptional regulator with XRE-family HTH domain
MPETFATTFERLREARGWSPAEVARRLGVYPTEVSRWRHGRGGISIRNVRKVADLFGVDRAKLEQLAGYGDSHLADTADTVEVERSMWHAVYDELIEKEVPRSMWQTYIEACQALARGFRQVSQAALNSQNTESLNRVSTKKDGTPGDPQSEDIFPYYVPAPRGSQRNPFAPVTVSAPA